MHFLLLIFFFKSFFHSPCKLLVFLFSFELTRFSFFYPNPSFNNRPSASYANSVSSVCSDVLFFRHQAITLSKIWYHFSSYNIRCRKALFVYYFICFVFNYFTSAYTHNVTYVSSPFDVCVSVHHIWNWREIPTWCNNLFIIINNSACFWHLYAHLQEY